MKIKKVIDKAIAFINAPISNELSGILRTSFETESLPETTYIKVKDDCYLAIEKTWFYDPDMNDIYMIKFNLGYGRNKDDDYCPEDEINFDGIDIHKINIADEIEYLLGCAFPNCKIER